MSLLMKKQKSFSDVEEQYIPTKFQIQNRRFLGNKFKLLNFIDDIISNECDNVSSLCDIFAGTGVVGHKFNSKEIKIISNDILTSNFIALKTFLTSTHVDEEELSSLIDNLNNLIPIKDNYFSKHFGNRYFTLKNARKIGIIRETVENLELDEHIKFAVLTSLIYAVDKVANTVGHYDAYLKKIDMTNPIKLVLPDIEQEFNKNNVVYCQNANNLIKKIKCDVLYIDPPYNSRQYCDAYHLLENLVVWKKPDVFGKAKKMDRANLKSEYCLKTATLAFNNLIKNANCRYILVSYNNTGESKGCRSNSRISDSDIIQILERRGTVKIFESDYKPFTTGKSVSDSHAERVFYCKVLS